MRPAGARLWRDGGATVFVVDDPRASPEALLSSLHVNDVRRLDVLIAFARGLQQPPTWPRSYAACRRSSSWPRPATGFRARCVPPAGSEVAVGGLVVRLKHGDRRLVVDISPAAQPIRRL